MTGGWIAAFFILALIVLVDTILLLGLLRRGTALLEHAEKLVAEAGSASVPRIGVQPGESIPPFAVADRRGLPARSEDLLRDRAVVMFMSAHCAPCGALAQLLSETPTVDRLVPLLIFVDDAATPRLLGLRDDLEIYVDRGEEAQRAFENIATPQAFLVEPPGVVSKRRVPSTVSDLESLGWQTRREVSEGSQTVPSTHDRLEVP